MRVAEEEEARTRDVEEGEGMSTRRLEEWPGGGVWCGPRRHGERAFREKQKTSFCETETRNAICLAFLNASDSFSCRALDDLAHLLSSPSST